MKPIQAFVAVAAFICAVHLNAAQRGIQFSELPEAVQKTAHEIVRDAKVLKVIEEVEKGWMYTVQYEGRGGRTFEVEISQAGKVLGSGELIAVADTAEAARKIIEERTKTFVWVKVIKATLEGQAVYVVKFDRGGDDEGQFTISDTGKVISE